MWRSCAATAFRTAAPRARRRARSRSAPSCPARVALDSRRQRQAGLQLAGSKSRTDRNPSRERMREAHLCPVVRVDSDVFGAQIARPDRGLFVAAGAEVELDVDVLAGRDGRRPSRRSSSCGCPSSNSTMPPMRTAARDRSNGTPDRPGRSNQTAPVRVAAVNRRLHEQRVRDRARRPLGVRPFPRARDANASPAWSRLRRPGRCRCASSFDTARSPASSAG